MDNLNVAVWWSIDDGVLRQNGDNIVVIYVRLEAKTMVVAVVNVYPSTSIDMRSIPVFRRNITIRTLLFDEALIIGMWDKMMIPSSLSMYGWKMKWWL